MTKKQAREKKIAWNLAISESRVVRYIAGTQMSFRAFASASDAASFLRNLPDGFVGNTVDPTLADPDYL